MGLLRHKELLGNLCGVILSEVDDKILIDVLHDKSISIDFVDEAWGSYWAENVGVALDFSAVPHAKHVNMPPKAEHFGEL